MTVLNNNHIKTVTIYRIFCSEYWNFFWRTLYI